MSRFSRLPQSLRALPAPVRWLAPPLGLLGCVALVAAGGGNWEPPVSAPRPAPAQATHCQALAKALPDTLRGHPRANVSTSPYVAAWSSSPRTVLRCGVPRPRSLDAVANQESLGPNVDGIQWYVEKDGHGGYRFTTTLLAVAVEVSVPAGAYPNYADPLSDLSGPVQATVPDISGSLVDPSAQDQ